MYPYNDSEDIEYQAAIALRKRPVTEDQFRKFEGYAAEIFSTFGLDLNTPATKDTPRRFVKALFDATEGYDGDPKLLRVFDTECRGEPDCRLSQVMEGPIHFFALCEHHALPFYGSVYIGYVANDKIIGISKLTRLVRLFSRRFAVQERIGQQLADSLETILHPNGVAVFVEAHHLCVEMRGVREISPITRTSVWRGHYANDPALRSEFISASRLQHA